MRKDRIVPLAMELGSVDLSVFISALLTLMPVGYWPASSAAWIRRPAEVLVSPMRLTTTSRLSSGVATPVGGDMAEQAVLDLVPLARARRQVVTQTRRPLSSEKRCSSSFHSRTRVLLLPPLSAVMRSRLGLGYIGEPICLPPGADRRDRKGRRVMVHADADPAGVGAHVVDPIGNGLAELLDR